MGFTSTSLNHTRPNETLNLFLLFFIFLSVKSTIKIAGFTILMRFIPFSWTTTSSTDSQLLCGDCHIVPLGVRRKCVWIIRKPKNSLYYENYFSNSALAWQTWKLVCVSWFCFSISSFLLYMSKTHRRLSIGRCENSRYTHGYYLLSGRYSAKSS